MLNYPFLTEVWHTFPNKPEIYEMVIFEKVMVRYIRLRRAMKMGSLLYCLKKYIPVPKEVPNIFTNFEMRMNTAPYGNFESDNTNSDQYHKEIKLSLQVTGRLFSKGWIDYSA